jgi:hypothetical protein
MSALTERIAALGRCGLWLDYTAYAGRLLANGAVPWLDADAAGGWMRKAQSLLKSDVAALPLAAVVEQWLQAHPQLATAMAAKRRAVFPLKTLLAEEPLRAHLVELTRVLRALFDKLPLVLALPSPRRWVALAYQQATGETPEIDADAVDGAAAYIADFLRAFADCRIDGLLLQETTDSAPASAEDLALYQPVFNVAAHYRWDVGLQLPADRRYSLNGGGPAFVLAAQAAAGLPSGIAVMPGFWSGEAPPDCAAGNFRYAEIPADAQPEGVLERLAVLR